MKLSLRDVLKKEGVTQIEFARRMNVTKPYVNQLCDVHRYWVEGTVLYGRSTRKKNGDLLIANIVIDDITKFF